MEKTDLAIALAGAVVLVVAVTASAVYGGTGLGGSPFSVTFPVKTLDLDPQSFQTQGSGEADLTFDVATRNVTSASFSVTATGPAGAASPGVRITVTTPEGEEFSSQGATITVPVRSAPEPFDTHAPSSDAVELSPPTTNGTGTWRVLVQITSPTPVPVPYTVVVAGSVSHYEAAVKPTVTVTPR